MAPFIKKILIWVYARFIRPILSPFKAPSDWTRYRESMAEFSRLANAMPYLSDPLFGLVDHTANPDLFFDEDLTFGRDCDDFARAWTLWGMAHGYGVTEHIVVSTVPGCFFKSAHVVTVIEVSPTEFWLMNYTAYGPFSSKQAAIDSMGEFPSFSSGFVSVENCILKK